MKSKIIWARSCVYTPDAKVPLHSHGFFQCLYVKQNGGKMRIGDHIHELKKKHFYLVPPATLHEIHAGDAGLISYEIKFELECDEGEASLLDFPSELSLSESEAEGVFKSIFTEMRSLEPYHDEMLNLKFRELSLILLRQNENLKSSKPKSVGFSENFAEILFYMERHISEPITLDTLAEISHLEKIYFLKKFKKDMHTPPMRYLQNLRMNEAQKLLLHADMNVTQIASAVGFPSVHHFSATFKKHFGMSPSEYKSSQSDAI